MATSGPREDTNLESKYRSAICEMDHKFRWSYFQRDPYM